MAQGGKRVVLICISRFVRVGNVYNIVSVVSKSCGIAYTGEDTKINYLLKKQCTNLPKSGGPVHPVSLNCPPNLPIVEIDVLSSSPKY